MCPFSETHSQETTPFPSHNMDTEKHLSLWESVYHLNLYLSIYLHLNSPKSVGVFRTNHSRMTKATFPDCKGKLTLGRQSQAYLCGTSSSQHNCWRRRQDPGFPSLRIFETHCSGVPCLLDKRKNWEGAASVQSWKTKNGRGKGLKRE